MWQVEKERAFLVLLDKSNGLVGVKPCQFCGIGRALDDLVISHQGHTTFVLEIDNLNRVKIVQQAEIVIKPLIARQKWLVKPKMPFADAGGGVAARLQQLGNRQFVGMNARS